MENTNSTTDPMTDQTNSEPSEPVLVADAFAVSILREYVRPAADQWARSARTAAELDKRDSAKNIVTRLQSLIAEHGPDAIISDGRNDVTLSDALKTMIVGKVVGGYIAAPDPRMENAIPADAIFRVAGSAY